MVKSPVPDEIIPNITVHELAYEHFRVHKNRVALVDGASGRSYKFSDLLRMCKSVASGLVRMGAKKGDVLAIHSPNTPEYAIIYLGAASAGVTVTTINPIYTVYEVTKQLEDSGATFMYTIETFIATAQEAAKHYGKIKKTIVLGNGDGPGLVRFSDLLKDDGKAYPHHLTFDLDNDILTLPYSSGTTGLPKGVILTHRNIVSNFCQYRHEDLVSEVISKHIDAGNQLTILGLLPFYHSFGQMVIMLFALMNGHKIVTLTHFEPELFLTAIQKYKINMLALVPPLVIFLAKNPLVAKFDLSSVIATASGAAPLSKDIELEACKILGITEIYQGYGLTETSPVATIVPKGFAGRKRGSVGVPVPNSEIQIVEVGSSKILGPNQTGEVWIKGPHIMKGYLNKPQATSETIDKSGWLHSGDIGYYDKDGFFYIVDRIKELIKYKGFQVPPAELEALLLTHPAVADAGVIGISDAEAGELPKAFIVKKPQHSVSEKDIHALVHERLTGYKQLRGGIEFVEQIPKSPSGKILRRELVKMHSNKSKL